jgi:hypothetical protein
MIVSSTLVILSIGLYMRARAKQEEKTSKKLASMN